jgi:hypothetical protein
VPEEEAIDVAVLPHAGGQHVVDPGQVVLLDLAMTDRLDGAEHAGAEQLARPRGQGCRGPFTDLAHDHVGADPLQRRRPAFEVDDERRGRHDRDEAGDQQALRREPAARQRDARRRAPRRPPARGSGEGGRGAQDVGQ